MASVKTKAIVDILMGVDFLITSASGLILKIVLPNGKAGDFFGISRGGWLMIHDISGMILIFLVIVHLILHWNWILNIPKFFKSSNGFQIRENCKEVE